MTHKTTLFIFLLVLGCFGFSCAKKENIEVDNESQCVLDHVIADQELMSIIPSVFKHMSATSAAKAPKGFSGNCVGFNYVSGDTIDFDPVVEFSLDASQLGCSLKDGKARSGKIHAILNGPFAEQGKTCTIKLVDYQAGGYSYIVNALKLSSKGSNTSYYSFQADLPEMRCNILDQDFTFNCSRVVSYYTTQEYLTFFGTAAGLSRTGEPFSSEVTKDIRMNNTCAYFSSGEMALSPENFKPRLVDFGEGDCDDRAIFAVNQNTVSFKLK